MIVTIVVILFQLLFLWGGINGAVKAIKAGQVPMVFGSFCAIVVILWTIHHHLALEVLG